MPSSRASDTVDAFVVNRDAEPVPASLAKPVVAIGNFDGVHLGHRQLVIAANEQAREAGRPAAVLTFEPHPRSVFAPDAPLFRLTPEPAKLRVLARLGLQGVFVRRFDAALASLSAEDFMQSMLAAELGVAGIVVGHDFRFGRGRSGTPDVLRDWCAGLGLDCIVVPPVERDGAPVSSSTIRASLERGDVRAANADLGHRWFVEGTVRHGDARGRMLGYPTANLRLGADCRLRHGIYAVRIALAEREVRDGVASFGRRPTFDDGAPLLEVHVFDFAGDLYGREVAVEFVGFIRGEERFTSAQALIRRMDEDSQEAARMLARAAGHGSVSMIG